MATPQKTPAKQLTDQFWGQNFIDAIPLKFRSALKYFNIKIPGVSNDTQPDEIGVDGVINSQVVTGRDNEREKTTSKLDGSVAQHVYHEQEYDPQFDILTLKDDYVTAEGAELNQPRRNIEGLVPGVDHVTTISPNTTFYDNYQLVFPGVANLNSRLPDILETVSGLVEFSSGEGFYSESGDAGFVPSGSASLSIRGSGTASIAVMPDLSISIVPAFKPAAPTIRVVFLLPAPITILQVQNKLANILGAPVSNWSLFNPKPVDFFVVGRRLSLRADASANYQRGGNDSGGSEFADSTGTGVSKEVGLTLKVIRTPPTLHAQVGAPGAYFVFNQVNAITQAQATAGENSADTGMVSDFVQGYAYGYGPATALTGYPTSGFFLLDCQAEPYKYGYVMIHAEIVDFANV